MKLLWLLLELVRPGLQSLAESGILRADRFDGPTPFAFFPNNLFWCARTLDNRMGRRIAASPEPIRTLVSFALSRGTTETPNVRKQHAKKFELRTGEFGSSAKHSKLFLACILEPGRSVYSAAEHWTGSRAMRRVGEHSSGPEAERKFFLRPCAAFVKLELNFNKRCSNLQARPRLPTQTVFQPQTIPREMGWTAPNRNSKQWAIS